LKPSLTVTVTIAVPVFSDLSDYMVATHNTSHAPDFGSLPETLIQFGGQVVDGASRGLAGAMVDILTF
jgi:hypothetical protein